MNATNTTQVVTISALIASSVTVILTKGLELWQSKQQYRLRLKQEFFLRKLTCFEKSIAFWTTSQSIISTIHVILKSSFNEKAEFGEGLNDALKAVLNLYNKISDSTSESISALRLYVDFKNNQKELHAIEEFMTRMGEILYELTEVNNTYNTEGLTAFEVEQLRIKRLAHERNIMVKMTRLDEICKEILAFVEYLTERLRSELRRFEA